jgi:serine phosphatase RsbU (regulator of sigma subunit)
MIVVEFHVGYGVIALLGAFVRDPSLGIRTAGRRLALSHVLVAAVPLVLLGGLWGLTTVLGVNNDRALIATRLIEAEGRRWERRLLDRLQAGGPWLAAAADSADWPGDTRAWIARGGTLTRVRGEPVAGEERLRSWADSLGRLPRSGFVSLDDTLWFGAAAVDSARGRTVALVLLPAARVLEGEPARAAGARLTMPLEPQHAAAVFDGAPPVDSGAGPRDSALAAGRVPLTHDDSLKLDQIRRVTRRLGIPDSAIRADRPRPGRVRSTTSSDTIDVSRSDPFRFGALLDGHALARGLTYENGRWVRQRALLAARVPPGDVLAGFYHSVRENPLGVLPIVVIAFVTGLVVLVVAFDVTMVANMGRSITRAIGALRGGAARLEAGDLTHRIELKGEDDLWATAAAFNQAMAGLERARKLEQERVRLESELALARQIQARLLPAGPPRVSGFEIAGLSESARQVGGDYFDHLAVDARRVLLVIADVSGKGVPAALLMSGFRASLMSQDLRAWDPVALADHLNDFLVRSVEPGKFVTAFLGFADAGAGTLDYVNAGHNPPVLWRAGGGHELLSEGGAMLGILPGAPFTPGRTRFSPGDLLVLYTDGVTEGANATGEMWGDERLIEAIAGGRARPCADLARGIADRVRGFEGAQGPADDVTLLIARRTE